MRIIVSVLGTLLILSVGCSSQSGSGRSAVNKEHPIIRTLATRDRNAVHVALWTLQQNGITNFQAISFDDPYSEVQPTIRKVCETLKALPDERMRLSNLAPHRTAAPRFGFDAPGLSEAGFAACGLVRRRPAS
jgi:hypothetical protein